MIRIAICDDDERERALLSTFLDNYKQKKNIEITYKTFTNGIDLIEEINKNEYHIILLDVLMPGMSGMETAREIRGFNSDVKIIFLTSSPEFAVESYSVAAYYYMLKPTTEERLIPILHKILEHIQVQDEGSLVLKFQSGIARILLSQLKYVEIINRTVNFYLQDGTVQRIYGKLSDFEEDLLTRDDFVKVHRSYIINLNYIQTITAREIITSLGDRVPVSRASYPIVKKEYLNHLFLEKNDYGCNQV